MKFDKRLLLAAIPLLLISTSTIAYAAFTVFSPVKTVSMQYTLELSTSLSGSITTLTATLRNNGVLVSGVPILFYHCDATGAHVAGIPPQMNNVTALGSPALTVAGVATILVPETIIGVYHYIAEFTTA